MTLRAARINKGLTIAIAAEKLGISPDTLGRWEKAETFPNVMQLKDIELLYDVSYNELNFLPANAV